MDEDDDDHMCLHCNLTVHGLENYLIHRKDCKKTVRNSTSTTSQKHTFTTSESDAQTLSTAGFYVGQPFPCTTTEFHDLKVSRDTFLNSHDAVSTSFGSSDFPDLSKILPTATLTCNVQTDLLAPQINLSVYTNTPSTCTVSPNFDYSPILSTTAQETVKAVTDIPEGADQDHGLLSTVIDLPAKLANERNSGKSGLSPVYSDHMQYGSELCLGKKVENSEKEAVDDFFQSLELMSKSERKVEKDGNISQLPITNILNSLTFSSDEDTIGFSFGDDVSFDSLTDSGDERNPPRSYTGGKWKPGEKPAAYRRNRAFHGGKWPPGKGPHHVKQERKHGPSHRGKNIALIKGLGNKPKTRGRKRLTLKPKKKNTAATNKIYTCNFCEETFDNRFKYSGHCGSESHKEKVFGNNLNKNNENVGKVYKDKHDGMNGNIDDKLEGGRGDVNEKLEDADDNSDQVSEGEDEEEDEIPEEDDAGTDSYDDESKLDHVEPETENADEQEDRIGNEIVNQEEIVNHEEKRAKEKEKDHLALIEVHVCLVCDRKFANKYMVAKHLLSSYHRNRSLAEPKAHFEMLEKYNKCIVRFNPYQCAICRYYFNCYEDFQDHCKSDEHVSKCEELTGEIVCTLCGIKTHTHANMDSHMLSADHLDAVRRKNKILILKEQHYKSKCKYCGLEIRSFERLSRHIQLKHADKKPVVGVIKSRWGVRNRPWCQYCERRFSCPSALNRHMKCTHANGPKLYSCKRCSKSYHDKYSLSRHFKCEEHKSYLKHKRLKKHRCDLCDEHFDNARDFHLHEIASLKHYKNKECIEQLAAKVKIEGSKVKNENKLVSAEKPLGENTVICNKETGTVVKQVSGVGENVEESIDEQEQRSELIKEISTQIDDKTDEEYFDEEAYVREREIQTKRKPKQKKSGKSEKIFKCDHCDFTVPAYNDLRPHYMEKHSSEIQLCEPCDIIFLSEKAFRVHCSSRSHKTSLGSGSFGTESKFYECDICKKSFPDKNYRDFHNAFMHFHPTSEVALEKITGKNTVTYEKFKMFIDHMDATIHDMREKISCPDCGACVQKVGMIAHLRKHTGEMPFKCKLCTGKSFFSSSSLRRHLLQHFNLTSNHCQICGKEYRKISSFKFHLALHNATDRGEKHVCDVCGMTFPMQKQLTRHKVRHSEKSFKCDYPGCHYKFYFQGELNSHKRVHYQEKTFLCDLCAFSASTRQLLARHKKTHTGERKFHCEYCTYKAGNQTHLKRHMRIHIGAKPFQCPYCNYACNTHENIRKHIIETKKHEGKKVYPCKFCDFATNVANDFHKHIVTNHEKDVGGNFSHNSLAKFAGLYKKELDPNQPEEGTQIIQSTERKATRRTRQNSDDDSDNEVKVVKAKTDEDWNPVKKKRKSKKRKTEQAFKPETSMIKQGLTSPIEAEYAYEVELSTSSMPQPSNRAYTIASYQPVHELSRDGLVHNQDEKPVQLTYSGVGEGSWYGRDNKSMVSLLPVHLTTHYRALNQ